MAGVGEAGAIVGLVSVSAKLSQVAFNLVTKYKHAQAQIETFANDVRTLGAVLGQLDRLLRQRGAKLDPEVSNVINDAISQCATLFSEIDSFCTTLHKHGSGELSSAHVSSRGKAKWILETAELQVLQARIDSTRMNILLLMTLECLPKEPSVDQSGSLPGNAPIVIKSTDPRAEANAHQIQRLMSLSENHVKRLQILEERMALHETIGSDSTAQRNSMGRSDTASSVKLMRDSILSIYSEKSFAESLSHQNGDAEEADKSTNDEPDLSQFIDHHIPDALRISGIELEPSEPSSISMNVSPSNQSPLYLTEENVARRHSTEPIQKPMDVPTTDLELPSHAKALRSYFPPIGSSHEIIIEKNEILKVSATNSKWWRAKKIDGTAGLVRAKCLVLQDDSESSDDNSINQSTQMRKAELESSFYSTVKQRAKRRGIIPRSKQNHDIHSIEPKRESKQEHSQSDHDESRDQRTRLPRDETFSQNSISAPQPSLTPATEQAFRITNVQSNGIQKHHYFWIQYHDTCHMFLATAGSQTFTASVMGKCALYIEYGVHIEVVQQVGVALQERPLVLFDQLLAQGNQPKFVIKDYKGTGQIELRRPAIKVHRVEEAEIERHMLRRRRSKIENIRMLTVVEFI